MSEIVLSTTNYDDYSTNGSMMMDINPGLVHHHHQKSVNDHTSTSPTTSNFDSVVTSQHQQYSTYPGKEIVKKFFFHLIEPISLVERVIFF